MRLAVLEVQMEEVCGGVYEIRERLADVSAIREQLAHLTQRLEAEGGRNTGRSDSARSLRRRTLRLSAFLSPRQSRASIREALPRAPQPPAAAPQPPLQQGQSLSSPRYQERRPAELRI